jgi:mannose-1-phosphate guanylyltransferase
MVITFMMRADAYLREMQKYLPKMYKSMMAIYQNLDTAQEEQSTKEQYELIDGISVDFGIMQKTRKAFVIKCDFLWDDIGTLTALGRFLKESQGNNITGNIFLDSSERCTIFGKDKLIIAFGIKDLIIVDAGEVILVLDKNKDQEIKYLVDIMKNQGDMDKYL